jgi:uncharacterized SAM-binding protein YcdF (DUF218 family)
MTLAAWIAFVLAFGSAGAGVWFLSRDDKRRARIALAASAAVVLLAALLFGRDLAMQKLVSHLIMPSGLFWIALGTLSLYLLAVHGRAGRLTAILFVLYTILGNGWLAGALTAALEDGIPEYSLADGSTFDVVFVLGGGATVNPQHGAQLSDQGDRVIYAARLFHLGKTPILVTSGSSIGGIEPDVDLTQPTLEIWRELGVPESAVRRIPQPKNTSQEIAAYKEMIAREGWKRIGIVSSAWHLPRIMRLARKAGIEATPLAADHRAAIPPFHPLMLIPQFSAANRVQRACWELVGMAVGR